MSKVCDICGKKPLVGYSVSHAHNKNQETMVPQPSERQMCQKRSSRKNQGLHQLHQIRPCGKTREENLSSFLKPFNHQHVSHLFDGTDYVLKLGIILHLNRKKSDAFIVHRGLDLGMDDIGILLG